jgi:DNA-directed RNA polymerase specialized sigma24 family protein
MSPAARSGEMTPAEETIRLLAVLVRQNLSTQNDAILELNKAGFGPTRISELVGTTPATVNVTVKRARGKATASAKRKKTKP